MDLGHRLQHSGAKDLHIHVLRGTGSQTEDAVVCLTLSMSFRKLRDVGGIRLMDEPFESLGLDALIVLRIIHLRGCQRDDVSGCILTVAVQARRCGSQPDPAGSQPNLLVRIRADPRTTARDRAARALDACLEDARLARGAPSHPLTRLPSRKCARPSHVSPAS